MSLSMKADAAEAVFWVQQVLAGMEVATTEPRVLDITGHHETLAADTALLDDVLRVATLGRKANVVVSTRIPANDEGLRLAGSPSLHWFGGSPVLRAHCRWEVA